MKYFSKTKMLMIIGVAMLSLTVVSCRKDFLDINNNPNSPTSSSITPELLFPGAVIRAAALQGGGNQTVFNNWMGYLGSSGDFVPDLIETRYDISNTFNTGNWTTRYDILYDLFQTKNLALAKGDSVLAGAAMIMSDKLWQELVDLYNNIPYTDAFHIERTSAPTYDNAASVYVALEADLDKAIGYMKGTASSTYPTTIGAVIHFGAAAGTPAADQVKWIHFANTLKLRMLIRTSEVTVAGLDRNAELAKYTANGGGLRTGETVNVNPGYSDQTGKQSPYYGNFGYTPTGIDASSIVRANKYSVDTLTARADPRLTYFYRGIGATNPSLPGGAVVGVSYGATTNPTGVNSSKVGVGTARNATQDQWILTSTESLFLFAEAVQRGWLTSTNTVPQIYQNAVAENFTQLGIANATTTATTYLATNTLANYSYANSTITNSSGTFTFTPIKFLAYQKYIALNQFDPLESYSDLRRLNMIPDKGYISKNANRLANNLPNRLIYPQEEYTLNFANVSAQGVVDKTTVFTSAKIFWQP